MAERGPAAKVQGVWMVLTVLAGWIYRGNHIQARGKADKSKGPVTQNWHSCATNKSCCAT